VVRLLLTWDPNILHVADDNLEAISVSDQLENACWTSCKKMQKCGARQQRMGEQSRISAWANGNVLKTVARSKVRQVGVVGHNYHLVFSQKLLDAQGCVGRVIVMVQEPIPTLPLDDGLFVIGSHAIVAYSSNPADVLSFPGGINSSQHQKRNQHCLDIFFSSVSCHETQNAHPWQGTLGNTTQHDMLPQNRLE